MGLPGADEDEVPGILKFDPDDGATLDLLGSWLGLLFSLALIAMIILRTALEDRFLRSGLTGYTEYAKTVKYRLIPRVW
ncbi:MAG TPA: hypothetical protein VE194_02395 [Rubrobacter sp.]|nr:hypothetical protein [Rubrobacter sp.]